MDALSTSIPGSTNLGTTDESEDFARELAKGMENLMRELTAEAEGSTGSTSTDNGGSSDPSAESARALKAVWEQMLVEGMDGNPGLGRNETNTSGSGFQDKIKQAVNKLKESESSLQVNYIFLQLFPSLTSYLNRLILMQHRMLNPLRLSLAH